MIKKLFIVFITSIFSLVSFNTFAKTTVTWWAEANADRDPVFQAVDGIRDPLWSRGLGDVYKRQNIHHQPYVF